MYTCMIIVLLVGISTSFIYRCTVKNTPPDKKTGWKLSFENTESTGTTAATRTPMKDFSSKAPYQQHLEICRHI